MTRVLQDFKKPEIYAAARSVLQADAHLQFVREHVGPVQAACIAKAPLIADLGDGQPVTRMARVYLSADRRAAAALYEDYKHALRAAGGFGLSDRQIEDGCCPELMAEQQLICAQNRLIELTGTCVGFNPCVTSLELRARYLELTMSMIASMPDFSCEIPVRSA